MKALIRLLEDTTSGSLVRALVAQALSDPELARAIRERWLAPPRAAVAEILRQGHRRGELRPDIDDEAAIEQLFAPVYRRLIFGYAPLTESLAEQLVHQPFSGISPHGHLPAE